MDDFFKSFKDNLEHREDPDFNPAAWQNMQAKMKAADNVKNSNTHQLAWWLPLLLLFLVGSVGLNYWFYTQFNLFKNQETTEKKHQNSIATNQLDVKDKTKVIYKTDTLYKTLYKTEYQTKYIEVASTEIRNKPTFLQKSRPNLSYFPSAKKYSTDYFSIENIHTQNASIGRNPFLNKTRTGLTINSLQLLSQVIEENKLSTKTNNELSIVAWSTTNPLDFLSLMLLKNDDVLLDYDKSKIKLPEERKSIRESIYQMRPKNFSLGLSGGLGFAIGESIESESKYTWGIHPTLIFNEQLSLFSECSYMPLKIETAHMDEAIGIPVYNLPNDDYIFSEAEGQQNIVQIGVGLQYQFGKYSKLKPLIGLGWYTLKVFPYKVKYEFEHQTLDNFIEIENELDLSNFLINQLLLKSGVAYHISTDWSIKLEAFYRFNYNKAATIGIPNSAGLRIGGFRKF